MILSRLACIKHISYALVALVVVLCVFETGLRLHNALETEPTAQAADRELIAKSWQTHHRLKPFQESTVQNPDTNTVVRLRTNGLGLRGPEPVVPKPAGVYRIVCLGDERVLGAEVEEADTFSGRLQEILQQRTRIRIEVVNAGVPGYCPLLSYLQVRHSLAALQPDLLILNFDMSDVADDHRYRRHTRLGDSSEPLACPHPGFDAPTTAGPVRMMDQFEITRWCKRQLGTASAGKVEPQDVRDIDTPQGRYAWLRDNPPNWSDYISHAFSAIGQLASLAEQSRFEMIVAVYPAPWQVSASACDGGGVRAGFGIPQNTVFRSRRPFKQLATYLQRRQIAFLDVSPAFTQIERPERIYLQNSQRFSQQGHDFYARLLAKYLINNVPGAWSYERNPPQFRQATAVP